MPRFIMVCLLVVMAPIAARAGDRAAAKACSIQLAPDARRIYDLTAPDVNASSVIRDVLMDKVKPLVMSGQMGRDAARAAATSAADCLKLLK